MINLNVDVLHLIAEFIEFSPKQFCTLAEVNRNFYQVFTSDKEWEWNNVYELEKNIYHHFITSFSELDKKIIKNKKVLHPVKKVEVSHVDLNIPKTTANKYVWLELYRQHDYDTYYEGFPIDDAQFIRYAIRKQPKLVFEIPRKLMSDPEVAFWALRSPRADVGEFFQQVSPLAHDKEFCKRVLDTKSRARWRLRCLGWLWKPYTQLMFFSKKLQNDFELIEMAYKHSHGAILLASNVTPEIIASFAPTEEAFLPIIKGLGDMITQFFKYYSSPKVLYTAYATTDSEDFDPIQRLPAELQNGHYSPEQKLTVEIMDGDPRKLIGAPRSLREDPYVARLVTIVNWRFSYEPDQTVVDAIDPEVRSDKEFIVDLLLRYPSEPNIWQMFSDGIQATLSDPEYVKKLIATDCQFFAKARTPTTKDIIQAVIGHNPRNGLHFCKDLKLPDSVLRDPGLLEYAAGYFENVLGAPDSVLTPKIIEKHERVKAERLIEAEEDRKRLYL